MLPLLPTWLSAQPEGRTPSAVLEGREISVPIAIGGAGPLFGLNAIAEALSLRVEAGDGGSTVLTVANQPVVLAAGSPIVTVGEEILSLSQPVTPGGGGLSVPLDFLRKVLGDPLGYTFDWAPESSRLSIARRQSRQVPVFIDVVHLQGTTTVVLQFPEAPRYRIDRGASRITVTPQGDRLTPSLRPDLEDPLVLRVEATPDQIAIVLRPGATFESYTLENPFRLVFDVHQPGQATAGAAAPPIGGAIDRPGVRTIVIDPGHGGPETGAIGPGGTREKDLTLVLAQALASRLSERLGVRTVLTRTSDVAVPHDTRAAIANQNKADLFVSVHLNSSLGAGAHGAETYFLSTQASDSRAASSALAENSVNAENPALDTALQDLQLMLWDLAQSRSLAESQRVANAIQAELNQALDLRDRGVKQAPFRVLMGAAMPAVLVELGFISNPDEEKKLADAGYRAQLVDALVRAIGRYKDAAEGRDTPPDPSSPANGSATPAAPTTPKPSPSSPSPTPPPSPRR